MAKTPVSAATPYATAADLLNAHDAGQIGNWATDGESALTPAQIKGDAVVAAALLRASGEVEMACYAGERYTPSDLRALTGASAAALKGLVCDLAFYHIAKRRIPNAHEVSGYKEAREMLDALRDGKYIFGFQEAADAGQIEAVDTSVDSQNRYTRPTELTRRFFGRRMDDFGDNPLTGTP